MKKTFLITTLPMTFVSPICVFGTGLSVAWDDVLHESGNIVFSNKDFYDTLNTAKFFDPLKGSTALTDAQKMLMVGEGIAAGLTPDQIAELTPLDAPTLLAQNFKNRLHSVEHQVTLKIASSLPKDLFEDEQTEHGASLLAHKGITAARIAQSSIHFVGVLGKATGALMIEKRVMDASSLVDLFGVLSSKGFFNGASPKEIQDVLASFIPFFGDIEDFKAIPVNSTPNVNITKCVDYIKLALEVNKKPAIYQKLDGTSDLMDSDDDKSNLLLALLDYPRITPKYVSARPVDEALLQNADIDSRKFSLDMALLDSGERTALGNWFALTANDPKNKDLFLAANQTGVLTGLDKAQDIIDIANLYQASSVWADANLNKFRAAEDKRKALMWVGKDITIGTNVSNQNETVFDTAMNLQLLDGLNMWEDVRKVLDGVTRLTLGGATIPDTYDETFTPWAGFANAFTGLTSKESRALLAFLNASNTATDIFDYAGKLGLFSGIENNWIEMEKILNACQTVRNGPDKWDQMDFYLSRNINSIRSTDNQRKIILWAAQNHPLHAHMFEAAMSCGLLDGIFGDKLIETIMTIEGLSQLASSGWTNEVHGYYTNADMMRALAWARLFKPFADPVSGNKLNLKLDQKKQLAMELIHQKMNPDHILELNQPPMMDPRQNPAPKMFDKSILDASLDANTDVQGRALDIVSGVMRNIQLTLNPFLKRLSAPSQIVTEMRPIKDLFPQKMVSMKQDLPDPIKLFDQMPYPAETAALIDVKMLSQKLINEGFSVMDLDKYGAIATDVIQALQPSQKDLPDLLIQALRMSQLIDKSGFLTSPKQNSFVILELIKTGFDIQKFAFVPRAIKKGSNPILSPQQIIKYIQLGALYGENPIIYQKFDGSKQLFAQNSQERFDILFAMSQDSLFNEQENRPLDSSNFINDTNPNERIFSIYLGLMEPNDRTALLAWFDETPDGSNKQDFMNTIMTGLLRDINNIDAIKNIIEQYKLMNMIDFNFLILPQDKRALLSFLATPVTMTDEQSVQSTGLLYVDGFMMALKMRILDGLSAWGNGTDNGLLATCLDLITIAGVTQGNPATFLMSKEFQIKADKLARIISQLQSPQDQRAALHFFAQDGNMAIWDKLVGLNLINTQGLRSWKATSDILTSYLALTKWSNFDEARSKFIPQENLGEFIVWAGTPGATHLFDVARSSALLNDLKTYADIKVVLDKLQNLSGFIALDIGAFDIFGSSVQAQRNALDWAQDKANPDIFDAAKQEGLINEKGAANGGDVLILLTAYKALLQNNDMNLLKGFTTPGQKSNAVIWYSDPSNAGMFTAINHGPSPIFDNLDLSIDAVTGKNAMQKIVDILIGKKIDLNALNASLPFLMPDAIENAKQRLNRLLIPMTARSMPVLFDNLILAADPKLSPSDEVIINLINMGLDHKDFVLQVIDIASLSSIPETPASRASRIIGFIIFNSSPVLLEKLEKTADPKRDLMSEVNKLGIDLKFIQSALPLLSPSATESPALRAARIGRATLVANGLGNATTGGTLADLMTGVKDIAFGDLKAASMLVSINTPQTVAARIQAIKDAVTALAAAGTDAGLVVTLGTSPEVRLALLNGYKTDANRALLKPASDAGIFKDFQATSWAQVSSILNAYKGIGADAANLISLAQTAPAKVLLLTGYSSFPNKARFASAFNVDKIFEGLEPQEDFAKIAKTLDNYDAISKISPQTGIARLFAGMQNGSDKRAALDWFSPAKAPFFTIESFFSNVQDLSVLDGAGQNGYQHIIDACLGGMTPQNAGLVDTLPESSNDRSARIKLAIALQNAGLSLNSKDVVNGLFGINPDLIPTAATFIGTPIAGDTVPVRIGKIQSAVFIASSDALKNVSTPAAGPVLMSELMGLGLSADMMNAGMPSVNTSIPEDAKTRAKRISIAAVLDQDISSPELVSGLMTTAITPAEIMPVMQLIDLSPGQDVESLLNNITSVASTLSSAGKNALKVMSFASNSVDKTALLNDYKTAIQDDSSYEQKFEAAYDSGLFEDLSSLSVLDEVSRMISKCEGVLIDGNKPWANLYLMLKSLINVQDKKTALDYFWQNAIDGGNDGKNYDLALTSGLLANLNTWMVSDSVTLAQLVNMYASSKAAIDASLTKFASPSDKRNFVIAHEPIAKWATTPSLLSKFANADDLKSLAAYFGDISLGVKRQKAYDKVSIGFGNTTWQNIMPLLNQYLPVDELLSADDATKLFAGNLGTSALTWVSSPANASMLSALNAAKLLDVLTDGATITASLNGYQTLVNSLRTAAIPLANVPVLGSALTVSSQNAQARSLTITSLNSKYATIANWSNVSAALERVVTASDKNALILYFSDATLGNSRRNTYDAIATYDDNAANTIKVIPTGSAFAKIQSDVNLYLPILTKVSSVDKTQALKYFTDATSGAARKTAYTNITTYDSTNVSSKIISSDLTTWSAIKDPIDQYLLTSPTSTELTALFGGMTVSADKRAALTWFGGASGANAAMMRAIMKTTLASGINDLTSIASSQNGYQRLVTALGATPSSSITTALNTLVDTTSENAVTRAKRIAATLTLNSNLAALIKNTNPAATIKTLATSFMGISVVSNGATVTLLTPSLITADVLTAIGGSAPTTESAANRANRLAFAIDIVLNPNLYKNMTTTATTNGAKAKELVDALIAAGVAPSKITPAVITSVGSNPAAGNAAARATLIKSK